MREECDRYRCEAVFCFVVFTHSDTTETNAWRNVVLIVSGSSGSMGKHIVRDKMKMVCLMLRKRKQLCRKKDTNSVFSLVATAACFCVQNPTFVVVQREESSFRSSERYRFPALMVYIVLAFRIALDEGEIERVWGRGATRFLCIRTRLSELP
jgi:hypothetical protein